MPADWKDREVRRRFSDDRETIIETAVRLEALESKVEEGFKHLEEKMDVAETNRDKALDLAAHQWPTRKEVGEELSKLTREIATAGVPRVEYQAAHKTLESRIDTLDRASVEALAVAKAGSDDASKKYRNIAALVAIIAVVLTVLTIVLDLTVAH